MMLHQHTQPGKADHRRTIAAPESFCDYTIHLHIKKKRLSIIIVIILIS